MSEEIINLKDYFIHYYDDWGRPYCVEFKGSPLELENSIKRLQAENEELKKEIDKLEIKHEHYCNTLYWDMKNQYDRYKQALEEIREIVIKNCDYRKNNDNCINSGCSKNYKNCTGYKILTKISEVLK